MNLRDENNKTVACCDFCGALSSARKILLASNLVGRWAHICEMCVEHGQSTIDKKQKEKELKND